MKALTAIILAIITYVSNLMTVIPTFVEQIKSGPDFSWMVTAADIRDVSYDEYYEFYQKNYNPVDKNGDTDPAYVYNESLAAYDNTELFQQLLDENLKICSEWKKTPVTAQLNFYDAVNDGGIWDYKLDQNIQRLLDAGWKVKGRGRFAKFVVYGCVMDFHILGNINFAFTAAATGFTPVLIKTGGGFINVKWNGIKDELFPYYFDEIDDATEIDFGLALYAFLDPAYVENAKLIDAFLGIVEPRYIIMMLEEYKKIEAAQAV